MLLLMAIHILVAVRVRNIFKKLLCYMIEYSKIIVVPNLYCQNSLKSNNGLSRIIYISLNGLYGGYLKTIAFILASNVEYRN